jgi:hypothetical protein
MRANFRESPKGEVRRIPFLGNKVDMRKNKGWRLSAPASILNELWTQQLGSSVEEHMRRARA